MMNKKRVFALLAALAFCFLILFSSVYIIAEADHDCAGEDCPICYLISVCENTLKSISNAVKTIAFAVVLTYILLLCLPIIFVNRCSQSLISLKVKLSN